jgi:type IV secretion/conjugal transfer VirB4 family ATPase
MLRLRRIFRNYEEAGALNAQLNLFGFLGDQVFLTKTGDLGLVVEVRGVDYECLEGNSIDAFTKRLESALRLFGEDYRIYQYLAKRSDPRIPHKFYGNSVVDAAIRGRIDYLQSKSKSLFSLSIYYVVLLERSSFGRGVSHRLEEIRRHPAHALEALSTWFSTDKRVVHLDRELVKTQSLLLERVGSFLLQVADFLPARVLDKQEVFRFFTGLLNFAPHKLENAGLKHDTFLDYYLVQSHLECHRGHLRVDDYYVKVLTLKEPSPQSFPLIFRKLLEVPANFYVVTEWKREDTGKTRSVIQTKRRHFHNTKRSFLRQINLQDHAPEDLLLDDSKEAQVRELGEGIKELALCGNYFGQFSLTVVIYDLTLEAVERASAGFYKVFRLHDAELYEERYNLLNAFLATVPGNHAWNLRRLYLLNTNYADYSFLFTFDSGETQNVHLHEEYLAVLETSHNTPYFLNLHHYDIAHSLVLGRTGAGKSFLLNFLITHLQKYSPHTFIFDLGNSFESLTQLFQGSYIKVGLEATHFRINPFSLAPTKENLDFLTLFVRVLLEDTGTLEFTPGLQRELYQQIENLYCLDPPLRTLGVLANILPHALADRLTKWVAGGQFGFLFDHPEDTVTFSRFQCFDFQQIGHYPELLEPLLFYILHRSSAVVSDRQLSSVFKAFFIDEAWVFLRNPSIQRYVVEALKTWRKHNAAMILSTQSLDELRRSEILDIIVETTATKIFLANPDIDRELYRKQFHLNETEIERIAALIPKQQFLIKTPERAKVASLSVDPKSYWLYTNDPYDNRKRRDAFEAYGFEKGLEVLSGAQP